MSSKFKEYSGSEKINLDLELIDMADVEEIVQALPNNERCEPLKKYKELHKKYASGFSPQKTSVKNLVKMYFNEIKINKDVHDFFASSISAYIVKKNLVELLEEVNLNEDENKLQLNERIEFAGRIAAVNCEIKPSTLLKLLNIKDKENIYKTVDSSYICLKKHLKNAEKFTRNSSKEFEEKEREYVSKINVLEKDKNKYFHDIKKLESDMTLIQEQLNIKSDKIEVIEQERSSFIKNLADLKKENDRSNNELNKQKNSNDKLKKQLIENTNLLNESDIAYKELELLYYEVNKNRLLEFDKTMRILLENIIDDLKNNNTLYNEILNTLEENIDENEEISNWWDRLSKKENSFIQDIVERMQINAIDSEYIEVLDEVENSLIAKYILIKSLKSLFFEYLSIYEKSKNMDSLFKS